MTTGSPIRPTTSWASSRVWAVPEAGAPRPISAMATLNCSRSSAVAMAVASAPISSTPSRSSTPAVDQLHGQVERGLAAQGGQQGVGVLALDDLGQHLEVERLDVGGVGEVGVGHDGGRVGVGQDDPVALLAQHPAGLGARVVELAGLADDDGAGPDQQDRLDVGRGVASGPAPALHQVVEQPEQVAGVVGARAGLGVVLHAEGRHLAAAEALDGAVVEVAVGDLDVAGRRRRAPRSCGSGW